MKAGTNDKSFKIRKRGKPFANKIKWEFFIPNCSCTVLDKKDLIKLTNIVSTMNETNCSIQFEIKS